MQFISKPYSQNNILFSPNQINQNPIHSQYNAPINILHNINETTKDNIILEKRLINYIQLKKILKQTKRDFYPTPEILFNITADDQHKILQYYNVKPRLAMNTPVYPKYSYNDIRKQYDFHCPIIQNAHKIDNLPRFFNCVYPTYSFKSQLKDQPVDHQYYYIDDDYQSPDHTVQYFNQGGDATRLNNKINTRDFCYIKY